MRVNISEARAFFPDSKRCLNPSLNEERHSVKSKRLNEEQRNKKTKIVGIEGPHHMDVRRDLSQSKKINLINHYKNNTDQWGQDTRPLLRALEKEASYVSREHFVPQGQYVDPRLQRKLDLMEQQKRTHRLNIEYSPINGGKLERSPAKGKMINQRTMVNKSSDILMLRNDSRVKDAPVIPGKKQILNKNQGTEIRESSRNVSSSPIRNRYREEYLKTMGIDHSRRGDVTPPRQSYTPQKERSEMSSHSRKTPTASLRFR
jgi:hypothetical protein